MGKKSKLFRVLVAGNTISDGRTITPEMIDEVVATFSAETYTPRINVEHISGFSPEPPFNGYGDVVAVEARDVELTIDGGKQTRRALYAAVDANPQLVALAAADQKPFPSVELTPSYAGTNKVGLVGLAFTDKPASIATEKLLFSRSAPGTIFAAGTDAAELAFETDSTHQADSAIAGFFSALTARFKGGDSKPPVEEKPKTPPAPPTPANDNDFAAFATAMGATVARAITAGLAPVVEAQAQFRTDFDALKATLETTESPSNFTRNPATGGANAANLTDF